MSGEMPGSSNQGAKPEPKSFAEKVQNPMSSISQRPDVNLVRSTGEALPVASNRPKPTIDELERDVANEAQQSYPSVDILAFDDLHEFAAEAVELAQRDSAAFIDLVKQTLNKETNKLDALEITTSLLAKLESIDSKTPKLKKSIAYLKVSLSKGHRPENAGEALKDLAEREVFKALPKFAGLTALAGVVAAAGMWLSPSLDKLKTAASPETAQPKVEQINESGFITEAELRSRFPDAGITVTHPEGSNTSIAFRSRVGDETTLPGIVKALGGNVSVTVGEKSHDGYVYFVATPKEDRILADSPQTNEQISASEKFDINYIEQSLNRQNGVTASIQEGQIFITIGYVNPGELPFLISYMEDLAARGGAKFEYSIGSDGKITGARVYYPEQTTTSPETNKLSEADKLNKINGFLAVNQDIDFDTSNWRNPASGEESRTFTLQTTDYKKLEQFQKLIESVDGSIKITNVGGNYFAMASTEPGGQAINLKEHEGLQKEIVRILDYFRWGVENQESLTPVSSLEDISRTGKIEIEVQTEKPNSQQEQTWLERTAESSYNLKVEKNIRNGKPIITISHKDFNRNQI